MVEEKSIPEDKKDLRNEISEIGYFTLFFSDPLMEERWNRAHLKRHISITTRFLFIAAVFQGLFLWSDVIEKQDHLFHLAIIRLMIGGFTLLGSFLVATGLLIPSQSAVLLINLCYGLPSMSLFYLTRRSFSHWQSLYLVYGMCFFILPKISPLSFIYAFLGSSLFTLSFILISAFRLSLQQWLLSNSLLLIVILLFFYDSYSSERITRERWLLRDRLQREHINLKIVASSLEDDFTKSSRHRHPLSLVPSNITNSSLYSARRSVSDSPSVSDGAHVSASPEKEQNAQFKRFVLFFKGLIAWALCYAFGYSFDFISLPIAPASSSSEAHSSAAFALLMHSMGFSIFLLYFTGQIRWLALNGVVSLIIMFIFNHTGMSQKWVIFSTHSLGYVLLAGVIVIMVLVFGGVVLVWTHLVNFIKDVLNRYPQVKDDLGRNQLLESVLIQYIADMPMTGLFSKDENTKHELIIEYGTDNESSRQLRSAPTQTVSDRKKREEATESISRGDTRMVLSSRRPNTCFFCSKPSPTLLVPACQGKLLLLLPYFRSL